jgi:metallo-beta-lactamase family protein
MTLQFLGAARTTTGSMYLLTVNNKMILLECGLYQGKRAESIERNLHFPFDPATLDVAILSHAHIDHCGNLPNLYKQGFRGNIFCTHATQDLAAILLQDSAHIQESDAEYVSKVNARKNAAPVSPLYTREDAEKVVRQFVAIGYNRPIIVCDGVSLEFVDAGHILGSAQVVLDIREGDRKFRYLFTGDIGRGGDPILRDPQGVEGVDYLHIESTYGNRLHESKAGEADDRVADIVGGIFSKNGKVIVPAFAVGRTQQIVWAINKLLRAKKMEPAPVFVDSPLAVNATEVYRLHPECFNEEIYKFLMSEGNPFEASNVTYIRDLAHSKKLNAMKGPMMIISASGMAEAGRILHHLKNNISNPNNLILFLGYCAEYTLGAKIRNGQSPVNIFGESYEVRAQVASMDSLSGHADKNELLEHIHRIKGNVKKVFVTHGEEEQALPFAETLRKILPSAEIMVPTKGHKVEL